MASGMAVRSIEPSRSTVSVMGANGCPLSSIGVSTMVVPRPAISDRRLPSVLKRPEAGSHRASVSGKGSVRTWSGVQGCCAGTVPVTLLIE